MIDGGRQARYIFMEKKELWDYQYRMYLSMILFKYLYQNRQKQKMGKNLVLIIAGMLVMGSMTAKFDDSTANIKYGPSGLYPSTVQLSGQSNTGKSSYQSPIPIRSAVYPQITSQNYEVRLGATGSSDYHQASTRENSYVKTVPISKDARYSSETTLISSRQDLPTIGGYTLIPKISQNPQALSALSYLQQNLSPILSPQTLLQCSSQLVNGMNYQFIFQLQFLSNTKLRYLVRVYKPITGKYQITKTEYYELSKTKPRIEEFVHVDGANSKSVKYMDFINDQVLFQLKDLFNGKGQLIDFDYKPPYFILNYRVGRTDVFKVEIQYDVVINAANILAVTKSTQQLKTQPQPAPSLVKQAPPISPTSSSAIVQQKIVRENPIPQLTLKSPVQVSRQIKTESTPKPLNNQPKPSEQPLKNQIQVQQQQPSPSTIIHTKPPKPSPPTFTIAQNTQKLLDKLSGVSDPALIPFLTSSETINTKQVQEIMKFLIEQVKITDDFTVVLINQIKYGIRVVVQMKQDHRLFEAVVTSDGRSPEILVWRRIGVIGDADPDVFNQYFRINPDEDLKNLIRGVFKSDDMIRRFKDIISAQKKVSYDGIYYRIIIQSTTTNKYTLKFYSIPQKPHSQILQYELLNNPFNPTSQKKLQKLPQNDPNFKKAQQHLFKNYAAVLKDTTVSFVSVYQSKGDSYYRLVFVGLGGKYEVVLMVFGGTGEVVVCRWEKMEDGYVPVQIDKLANNDQFRSIRLSVKEYIQNKFKFDADPSYLEVKNIPGSNSFYKLLFEKPFPFILSIQERDTDHSLYIRGLQRIQIAPSSEYYNDRVFAGYSSLKLSELPFDDIYQVFYTLLQKQTQIQDGNHEVAAAFRMKTPEGIYYKIVYRVNGNQYLASFSYVFVQLQYKLLSFQAYSRLVEQGDYRWKCTQVNEKSASCGQCQTGNILTVGRCYRRINGCSLQIASSCQACEPGFIRTHQLCEISSQKSIPKPAPLSTTSQTIVTASGPKTVTYQNGNDQNCLQYRNTGCVKCSNRFYVNNGICKKVQDQCETYSEEGICYKCYQGYYLSNQLCVTIDPLCAQSNNNGFCIKCYKNYLNIQGKCYIKSNIDPSPSSPSSPSTPPDQLCQSWQNNTCTKCEWGCFLSKKTNKCTIKDPFCQDMDYGTQECGVCMRGYRKNGANGNCERYV